MPWSSKVYILTVLTEKNHNFKEKIICMCVLEIWLELQVLFV